jgi:hypothetical protein
LTTRKLVGSSIKQPRHSQLVEHGLASPVFADCLANCAGGKHGLLSKNSNSGIASAVDYSVIGRVFTTQDSQQSAFPAPIQANNANSVTFGNRE